MSVCMCAFPVRFKVVWLNCARRVCCMISGSLFAHRLVLWPACTKSHGQLRFGRIARTNVQARRPFRPCAHQVQVLWHARLVRCMPDVRGLTPCMGKIHAWHSAAWQPRLQAHVAPSVLRRAFLSHDLLASMGGSTGCMRQLAVV